jgi:hypothetical protein
MTREGSARLRICASGVGKKHGRKVISEVRWDQPSDAIAAIDESELKSLVTAAVVDVLRKTTRYG